MNGKYLLDTNIIIALFAKDPRIHALIAEAEEVSIPCIAIGELYFGAYKSAKIQNNVARIDEFVLSNTILSCNSETAKRYGDIKNRLKEKGQPLPENDMWIAAIAEQHALALVTNDSHFDSIENLELIKC